MKAEFFSHDFCHWEMEFTGCPKMTKIHKKFSLLMESSYMKLFCKQLKGNYTFLIFSIFLIKKIKGIRIFPKYKKYSYT